MFCHNAVSHAYGRVDFKVKSRQSPLSSFVSVSTEAFAMFVVEGNYERWMTEFQVKPNTKEERKQLPANKFANPHASRRNEGYDENGIKEFLKLCIEVHNNRKKAEATSMENRYIEVAGESFQLKGKRRQKKAKVNLDTAEMDDVWKQMMEFGKTYDTQNTQTATV